MKSVGEEIYYWTSTENPSIVNEAYSLSTVNNSLEFISDNRTLGLQVRAVIQK